MKDLLLALRFLIAPVSSWTMEKQNGHLPSKHERGWFYPLLAVVGASSFVQMLYGETLTVALVRGIAMFSAFFLGYMISSAVVVLDKDGRVQWAKDGALTQEEVQQVMDLLHKLINK